MLGGEFSRTPAQKGPETAPQDDKFVLGRFSIDEYKPIKVIVIGAGFSGILAGIRFPQKIPNVDLVIYEKSAGVGGTWYNNRYPGIACDFPAHCYQFSFEDKRDWTSLYPPGHETQEHLQDIVDRYKLMRYIKLNHEVAHARYDESTGKWHVRIHRTGAGGENGPASDEFEDVADVLVTAFGALTRWKMPDIPGIDAFKGELHHTAGYKPSGKTWEDDLDRWRDKRVGVVGSGSTAIQTVSALAPHVKELSNYVRGQTWLSPPFVLDQVAQLLGRKKAVGENELMLSSEEIARFQSDDEFFRTVRHTLEDALNSMHAYTQLGSKTSNHFQEMFRKNMKEQLAAKPDVAEKLIPGFPVSCRRLTPGPGYLEALCADHVDFVSSPIKQFTATGIETEDGKHKDLDLIFCATGYDTSWQLPFKIIGRNGVDLNEKWEPYPKTYLSVAVDGFPNMFMSLGPNSGIGVGTLLPIIEQAVMYAVQATAKIQRERLKSMEAKPKAVKDFDRYIESYFPQTVFSANCRSWYKLGKAEGRVVGLWPGSNLHATRALQHPRWEDYEYEYADSEDNLLYWLEDGQTWAEKSQQGDRAWYLREEFIDRPPVPQDV
ncbi:FAD/NAD(P)-binding domain-containing protein [Dichomitus squalens LYAD-421 SS1]|uniref:FAD/NAD(P)-binding domain-containing protein n=1 Tax=Dichomitus squalens (strain LYAD-421) TaxID=732165 RepID=R7SKW4_DICSQ|nr:FAD/NAD(P)-binding domain-containing protein [Dichomitus squalens LYAD-421 SS1]EJF55657.1 FAD/NAD(P)-binding domain-containing protein [Dichomitus squalens LYAD-421 SS1]